MDGAQNLVYMGLMSALDFWDYVLPDTLIARYPASRRDGSRLMVCNAPSGQLEHTTFAEIGHWLRPNDLLVANNTRVMAARLFGKRKTGGKVEFLVLSRRAREGSRSSCKKAPGWRED